ncbi:long-chain-fatty-acid--CoA ligase [Rhizobium sp. FKL33]|uniref:long-chain-fatty-acid--CoA ligase n=1 Tax=Rhizobium sp. FKL33 TaxID=2562307 RepID=UPI0010C0B6B1|nr:long-chain-fatty-acid--CoA ligase [Rhizobium sp. FKL33]
MTANPYPLLIKQILAAPLAQKSPHEIVHADIRRYGYPEFAARIARLGGLLGELGLGQGSTIAVMDWDSHRYLECFFAAPMIGATLHTVNIRLSAEQVLYTINHAGDDAILCHVDFLPLLADIRDRITRPFRLIVMQDNPVQAPADLQSDGEYEALMAEATPVAGFPDFDENTRATLFYTTGTTGAPKGVFYTHRQLVLHTLGVAAGLGPIPGSGFNRDDVYMPITPLFHVHGWGIPYVATMLGAKQVYPGRYEAARLLSLISEHRVTFSHCVPTILSMILNAPGAEDADLSGWRVIIGGSALSDALARSARMRGVAINAAYGMSETCPFLTVADMMTTRTEPQATPNCTAAGKPMPMVDVRIVDETMSDVPADGVSTGEIVVRAPWLTSGYLNDPVGSGDLWRGGWLHTGDVGLFDASGALRITDRLKDVIKTGGEWVSSLALENLASEVAGVSEAAAIGCPDPRWGERPLLIVASRRAADDVKSDIRARIAAAVTAGQLSKWATPDRIEIVSSLPKTSVGKLDKKALRAQYVIDKVQA